MESIKLVNWAEYKERWSETYKQIWVGNNKPYCDYCCGDNFNPISGEDKDIYYFELTPHGLESSNMCLECAKNKMGIGLLEFKLIKQVQKK